MQSSNPDIIDRLAQALIREDRKILDIEKGKRPDIVPRLAFSINDACAAIGIGRTSLYELISTGAVKPVKIAGRTLIPRTELERLIREAETAEGGAA
jgi:hypothetical protein